MTFVLHVFGRELFRFTFGRIEEDTEYVDNTGGDFDLPFGFALPTPVEDEDED